jgi:hypothetical protein
LLRGMLRCGYCGQVMRVWHMQVQGKVRWFYRCRDKPQDGEVCGSDNTIVAWKLDQAVWNSFAGVLSDPDTVARLYRQFVEQQSTDISSNSEQLQFLDCHLQDLEKSVELKARRLSEEENDVIAAYLRHELAQALAEGETIANIRQEMLERERRRTRLWDDQEATISFLQTAWQRLHQERDAYVLQRDLMRAFDVRIVVWKRKHTPRWVLITGSEELVANALAGKLQSHLLFDGSQSLVDEIVRDLELVVRREARARATRSGRRKGVQSDLERKTNHWDTI